MIRDNLQLPPHTVISAGKRVMGWLTSMNHVMIIAEVGVHHNGSVERAIEMIDEAASSGVDVVKFQTFNPSSLVTKSASLADYQVQNIGKPRTQQSMLASLELSQEDFSILRTHCDRRSVESFQLHSMKKALNSLQVCIQGAGKFLQGN